MEDFKSIIKMKTGGSVSKAIAAYEKRERKSEEKSDMAQDKAVVKKAIAMHDKQEHPGEKTNLSKLKKGGRSKKECGTVKKFEKASGEYGAKKGSSDIKRIKEAKQFKPAMCKGGKMSGYAEGGSIDDDVRERARKWMESGSPEQTEAPVKPVKSVKRAKAAKLSLPDYSNEDLDRMGMNNDLKPKQPESDREEYSPWMREYRREEAKAKASTKADPEMVRKAYVESAKYTKSPRSMKSGKKVC
jgi:hypothetical protein